MTAYNEDEFYQFAKLNNQNTQSIPLNNQCNKVVIGDFQLLKILGKGSFGKVMLVEHQETKKLYAMKVLLKSSIKNER